MDYISTKEAAALWGVCPRQVQRLIEAGRVPSAKKFGNYWMLPKDAKKPTDPRRAEKPQSNAYVFFFAVDLPKSNPDAVLEKIDKAFVPLAAADLAFRRGDPEPAKAVWRDTPDGDESKLSAASLAAAAAISSGDYGLYEEIQAFLAAEAAKNENKQALALLSLPEALAAVSMAAVSMTPDWLKGFDFSLFPSELRPFLLYLYVLHLRNTGDYTAMLAAAKATLALRERDETFTWLDVYLAVLCGGAACALGDMALARQYLDKAAELGLPSGFVAPFADSLGSLGGIFDAALQPEHPEFVKTAVSLWNSSFKNWMRFHNRFTKDNITLLLSPQEYQTAYLISHGATYSEAARRMRLSVSRIKNLLAGIYSKLYIQNKQELAGFIL